MQKGKINVKTENIFPIIKKFLYSDHEIFLRELVSNAVDATQKLNTLSTTGDFKGEMGDTTIQISLDAKAKTLTISDKGIGMTAEEVKKYINQIAFSSAEEFLEKYKDQNNGIIGHFGLGFYSSFMVSKKVEIFTKSYADDAVGVKWSCDGSPNYTLDEIEKEQRGTDIVLHIDDENKEFLEESRILQLLKKYCKFLPVEIAFGKEKEWKDGKETEISKDRIINNTKPAWTKKPADLKDEDYLSFYHELYPVQEDPLFNIHLNVDYPFHLTGILYFPRIKSNIEIQKNKIQLYSNQVYVTDSVEGVVPEFLTLLHGVIDSPDIPLNVSRSYLQTAEIYLNYAEALNEAQGPVAAAYDAVNTIRARSGMPALPNGLSKDEFRERVRKERGVEFAFEGHRWWDIRRWLIAEDVNQGDFYGLKIYKNVPATDPLTFRYERFVYEQRVWPKRFYLEYFPVSQINLGYLVQNPGW